MKVRCPTRRVSVSMAGQYHEARGAALALGPAREEAFRRAGLRATIVVQSSRPRSTSIEK